jgi:hypothetical protein
VIVIIGCAVLGGVGSRFAQPYVGHNSDVVLVVVTIFSVFAGFLIATITIIGDPVMIREGSWRIAEGGRNSMRSRLIWHIALLFLYLMTLGVLFLGVILDKALDDGSAVRQWVEYGYLFLGITSFLLTFALPVALLRMQQERYDAEIERRRDASGIRPE